MPDREKPFIAEKREEIVEAELELAKQKAILRSAERLPANLETIAQAEKQVEEIEAALEEIKAELEELEANPGNPGNPDRLAKLEVLIAPGPGGETLVSKEAKEEVEAAIQERFEEPEASQIIRELEEQDIEQITAAPEHEIESLPGANSEGFAHGSHIPLTEEEMHKLELRVKDLERRLDVVEAQEAAEPWHGDNGPGIADFLSKRTGSPGILVDEGVARATPCICFEIDKADKTKAELCFSKGIVGALDEGQKTLFCPDKIIKQPTEKQKRRIQGFQEAASVCKGQEVEPWLQCMSQALKSKGIEEL